MINVQDVRACYKVTVLSRVVLRISPDSQASQARNSPGLNPDELLNQDVKSNAVGLRRALNQYEIVTNV